MTPRTSAFFFENNFRIITEQLYHKSRNFYPHYLQHFNVLRATLWCLIDSPPRLLIFGIFSTQDILIPTPRLLFFQKYFNLDNLVLKIIIFFFVKNRTLFSKCVCFHCHLQYSINQMNTLVNRNVDYMKTFIFIIYSFFRYHLLLLFVIYSYQYFIKTSFGYFSNKSAPYTATYYNLRNLPSPLLIPNPSPPLIKF